MSTIHNIDKNKYYQNNPKYFLELFNLIKEHPLSYFIQLKAKHNKYKHLYDWINSQLQILNDSYFKISTKCYWIVHNIQVFPICNTCGKEIKRNCGIRGYTEGISGRIHCANNGKCANNDPYKINEFENYCIKTYNMKTPLQNLNKKIKTSLSKYGTKYPIQSNTVKHQYKNMILEKYGVTNVFELKAVKEKIKQTNIKKYGVEYPAQNHEIFRKQRKKYIYNNIKFDSSWELAYYIWLDDNNIKFEYQPNISFDYITLKDNKKRKYFPDFKIDNDIYEIKGNQFFNKNNEPITYNKYPWFEKYQCIINNNVKILLFSDIKEQYDYCCKKFNNNHWYKQFKNY